MKTSIEMVEEFHRALGHPILEAPNLSNPEVCALRFNLLAEELEELADAIIAQDNVAALDALSDLQYVLDGAYLALGFKNLKDQAFAEVHRSNMSKMGPDGKPLYREDGKVLKGPNYTPPNLAQFIKPNQFVAQTDIDA